MNHIIQPYNPNWATEFERLKEILSGQLQDFQTDIQHVGSTAIPGMPAKPVLDIDIIIADSTQLAGIAAVLEALGYTSRGEQGIPGRFAFRQTSAITPAAANNRSWMKHHLYVCLADSLALKNHLVFRNAMLNDTHLAADYALLKTNLAAEREMTRENYTKLKTEYILTVLAALGFDATELDEIKRANA